MATLFNLEIITPQGLFLQEEVESLTIKLSSGYRTFLAKHLPLIGAIEYDEMHIMKNNNYSYFAVHGGIINVTNEKITLLVNNIEKLEDIDLERALKAKERALQRLQSKDPNIDIKRAQLALNKSLARINTVNYQNKKI